MKNCISCGKSIHEDDKFCTHCGVKQDGAAKKQDESIFMKYSGYLDNDALYKVAWAKEKGLIQSDCPNEAETLYQTLALKGHLDSMFRYAMLLLAKEPAELTQAEKWLKIAAGQGHVQSINYLATTFCPQKPAHTESTDALPIKEIDSCVQINNTNNAISGKTLSGAEISKRMSHSVVELVAATPGRNGANASGFLISSNGFIITNAHAVLDDFNDVYQTIHVKYLGKKYRAVPVAIGQPTDGENDVVDIALLHVDGLPNVAPAVLGDSDQCETGQNVYLIGNSMGEGTCITSGIISDRHRKERGVSYPFLMTDAAANPGNSGGPMLNDYGETVGVLVSGTDEAQGMNYAIPINVVKSFLTYVYNNSGLSRSQCAELAPYCHAATTTEAPWRTIFRDVRLFDTVISFIQ